jgi:hypothetical protein
MIFGDCIDLTAMDSSQTGPGTWNAAAGTWSTTLPGKGSCGGAGGDDFSLLHLVAKACGKIRVTASGDGYIYPDPSTVTLIVYSWRGSAVVMQGPGGGSFGPACETGALANTGGGTGELQVDCGDDIYVQFGRTVGDNAAAIRANVTFAVE